MSNDVPILIRESAERPSRTTFENGDRNRQQQLFSRGIGELPGQTLLFDPLDCHPGAETEECEH